MKTFTLIQLFFITFFLSIEAQNFIITNGDTINYIDSENNKQGFWRFEEKKTEGYFLNNEKTGIWKSFYKSGNLKSEITYENGKKRGYAKIFYEDGKIAEEGTWMEDKWTGKYKSYYRNGKLSYVWNYNEKGNRSGYQKYYYKNGNVKIEGKWEDGKESGLVKEYYSSGVLKSKKIFCKGRCDIAKIKSFQEKDSIFDNPIKNNNTDTTVIVDNNIPKEIFTDTIKTFKGSGQHILYNKNRNPEKEGEFFKGVLINGKHYFYNKNNILIKTAVYKSGEMVKIILNQEQN